MARGLDGVGDGGLEGVPDIGDGCHFEGVAGGLEGDMGGGLLLWYVGGLKVDRGGGLFSW